MHAFLIPPKENKCKFIYIKQTPFLGNHWLALPEVLAKHRLDSIRTGPCIWTIYWFFPNILTPHLLTILALNFKQVKGSGSVCSFSVTLWLLAAGLLSFSLSDCCVKWILSSIVITSLVKRELVVIKSNRRWSDVVCLFWRRVPAWIFCHAVLPINILLLRNMLVL